MRLALLLLVALALLPLAAATDTLDTFQEPHTASSQVYDFDVVGGEAYNYSGLVFMNPIGQTFRITIFAQNGTAVYNGTFSRHIDTLPKLEPGPHRLFVDGAGNFAITRHYLDSLPAIPNVTVTDVNRTLSSKAESWILLPSQSWYVRVSGNVGVEWINFLSADPTGNALHLTTPTNQTATTGKLVLVVVRGEPGTPYAIHLDPVPEAAATPTPAARTPGFEAPVAACAALIAMAARRLGRRRP